MQRFLLCSLALISWAGCVHTPTPDSGGDLPAGAPEVAAVLRDLTREDRRISNFSSLGTIRMQLPGQAARQRFTRSYINYERPARFHARAMKGTQSVNIYVEDDSFLLDNQADRILYFGREGDQFDDVALDVSPSLVFREFFLADTLANVAESQVRLLEYDPNDQRVVLGIFDGPRNKKLTHRLHTTHGPEGWRVVDSELMGAGGQVIIATHYREYAVVDSVFMPTLIESELPGSDGLLSFEIQSNARANRQATKPPESIEAIRATLRAEGYREVLGRQATGKSE